MARDAGQIEAFRLASQECPIPAAVELIAERWTCLILRASMFGLRHFEEFQGCLGIARNILSDRLAKLVEAGILARNADPNDRLKVIYALTERGAGLLPTLISLRQWALDFGLGSPEHQELADIRDGKPLARMQVRAHDGRPLTPCDLMWVDHAGEHPMAPSKKEGETIAA